MMFTVLSQIAQVAKAGHITSMLLDAAVETQETPAWESASKAHQIARAELVALLAPFDASMSDLIDAKIEGRRLVTTARGWR